MSVYTLPEDKTGYSKKMLRPIAERILATKDVKTIHSEVRAWLNDGLASGKQGRTAAVANIPDLQATFDQANALYTKWGKVLATAVVLYNVAHKGAKNQLGTKGVEDLVRANKITSAARPPALETTTAVSA